MITLEKKIQKEILEATKGWKEIKITKSVPDSPALLNHRCMYNAIEEYHRKNAIAVLEVISDTNAIAHYLCMDANGDIYDPTLGWNYSGCTYRLSRYIHPDIDGPRMGECLNEFKDKLFGMCSKKTRALLKLSPKSRYEYI